jgi:molecular chaperone DnaK (HSP70)
METNNESTNDESTTEEIAIAIDLGTSNSGYAWGKINEAHSIGIRYCENWPAQIETYVKTPTVILIKASRMDALKSLEDIPSSKIREWLDSDEHELDYGYSALKRFASQDGDITDTTEWCLFSRFKMKLNKGATKVACEGNQKEYPLDIVIGLLLGVMKAEAVKSIALEDPFVNKKGKCRWAVTIPAIWKPEVADFMRKICEKVVAPATRLIHEPEAAAIAVMKNLNLLTKKGEKIMVIDAGGGTCDFELYIIDGRKGEEGKFSLKEIVPSDGVPAGGTSVDNSFWELLAKKMAMAGGVWEEWHEDTLAAMKNLLEAFWKENRSAKVVWQELWEMKKKEIQTSRDAFLRFSLTDQNTGYKIWLRKSNEKICNALDNEGISIKFSKEEIEDLVFKPAITKILNKIEEIHEEHDLSKIDHFFLVGGFAGSVFLRSRVSELIQKLKGGKTLQTLNPRDAGAAILGGAAYSLANPFYIARIAKLNYYLSILTSGGHESAARSIAINYLDRCEIRDVDRVKQIFKIIIEKYTEEVERGFHEKNEDGDIPFLVPILVKGQEIQNFEIDLTAAGKTGVFPIYATDEEHVYSEESLVLKGPIIAPRALTKKGEEIKFEIIFENESKAEFRMLAFNLKKEKILDETLPVNLTYGSRKSND